MLHLVEHEVVLMFLQCSFYIAVAHFSHRAAHYPIEGTREGNALIAQNNASGSRSDSSVILSLL
jgi:hypothetical protein